MNSEYAYIYDDFLKDHRYQEIVASIEVRLASMNLSGRIGRLSLFRSPEELVHGFINQGVKNIVIVGNDNTVNKMIHSLADLPVVLGYIPVAEPYNIASLLNIPVGVEACNVVGARLIDRLDLGKVNDRYFLTEVAFNYTKGKLRIANDYTLSMVNGGAVLVRNLGAINRNNRAISDVHDGLLESYLLPFNSKGSKIPFIKDLLIKNTKPTKILFKEAELFSLSKIEALVDQIPIEANSFKFSIESKKMRFITSRVQQYANYQVKKTGALASNLGLSFKIR